MAIPMPGPYQVSQTIQEILQKRRDESRQAMIDKLDMDRTQASMAAETRRLEQGDRQIGLESERNALQKLSTESQIQQAKNQEFAVRAANLPFDPRTVDVDSLDPDFLKYLETTGRLRTTPGVPDQTQSREVPLQGSELPALMMERVEGAPAQREYTGSPDWQKQQYGEQKLTGLASQFGDKPDMRRFLQMQAAGVANPPERLLGDRNAYIYDHRGNRTATQPLGPYDEIVQTPQPYQMPTWGAPKPYQEIDGRTGRVIRSHSLDQTQYAMLAEQLAPLGHVLVASTAPFGAAQGAERAKDMAARQFGAAFTSNAPRAQRTAELNQARTNLIFETNVSNPEILTALNLASERILAAVDRNGTVPADTAQKVVQTIRARYPQMSEDDVAEVSETLNLLLTNIPKAEPQAAPPTPPPAPPSPASAAPIVQQPRSTPVRRDPVRR